MSLKYQEILSPPLRLWNIGGVNPQKYHYKGLILAPILFTLIIFLVIIRLISDEMNQKTILESCHSIMTVSHFIIYWTMLVTNGKEIVICINNVQNYWNFDDELNRNESIDRVIKLLKFFSSYAIFVSLLLSVYGYAGYGIILPCYIPTFMNYYIFVTILNITFILGVGSAVGSDLFISGNLFLLFIQFTLLSHKLKSIDYSKMLTEQDEEVYFEEITKCIKHHDFLLKCCENLNGIFTYTILIYFIIITISLCVAFYSVSSGSDEDLNSLIVYSAFLLGLVTELFLLYCLPAEYLANEASNIKKSIYFSNWYECRSIKIRRALVMMMTRGQRPIKMSAGDMMPVNMETCTTLFKNAMSFYTFIDNVKTKL